MTDPQMSDGERVHVVRLLQQTRDDFLATVTPVTDAQWDFRPGLDRWSIGLIAEHLGLVERGLFGRIERALEGDANPDWQAATAGKDELIEKMLRDRGTPRRAPERVVPIGTVGREEALRIYRERRARSLAFAETTADPLRTHTVDHHRPVFGTLNGYQWLLYIPLHNQRHIQQIEEIKAAPGYPSGD
ncbi:MAG: DinB family protein [Acidobacteria bacterium]|nr:DinB family protein [Acidobacteriota bacterium]TDI26913.1 MAG: DinB family protein [Acidobacteriota bacterium]